MIVLGIESSCDDTSVSVVKDGKHVLSNIVFSQDHNNFGGVFPEHAAREHLNKIEFVYKQALTEAKIEPKDIDYIAGTYAPGLVSSLLVGFSFAKGLAYSLNKPLIPVHHIKGHVYGAFIEHDVKLPAIALVVSGGHSVLIKVDEKHNFEEIGASCDDAVGEAFDKVGRMFDMPFPAGLQIDKMYDPSKAIIDMPIAQVSGRYDFSFSGLKTFVMNTIKKEKYSKEEVISSFQKGAVKALVKKAKRAMDDFDAQSLLVTGGVASNSLLRSELKSLFGDRAMFPSIKLCLDNGGMIAAAAYYLIEYDKVPTNVRVKPNIKVDVE